MRRVLLLVSYCQKWRNAKFGRFLLLWHSVACSRQQEDTYRQVGSARASHLAFFPIASQPRRSCITSLSSCHVLCFASNDTCHVSNFFLNQKVHLSGTGSTTLFENPPFHDHYRGCKFITEVVRSFHHAYRRQKMVEDCEAAAEGVEH